MVIISATLSVGMMNLENCVDSVFANNMPLDVPVVIIAKWSNHFAQNSNSKPRFVLGWQLLQTERIVIFRRKF